jgi:ADP-heptose:LPS heptosyltransferase
MDDESRPIAVIVDREGLGDVILKLPFLRALRRAFPSHPVWWIATHQTSMADDLRPMFEADVAKVIPQAGLDGAAGPLLQRLRALPPFERVFDSRTKISTVALTRFALTHRGFYCALPGFMLCDGAVPFARQRSRHNGERMLALIPRATGEPARSEGRLEASASALAEAERRLPGGPTYVGIAPGSRQPDKNWPFERFLEAARAMTAECLRPVFFLGPQEAQSPGDVEAAVPGAIAIRPPPGLAPTEGFDRLIAQGQRLALLLANDNGVGHLMGAAGTPVVSLFGPKDPRKWAPFAPANVILEAKQFGGGDNVAAIPLSAVLDGVRTILNRRS